MVTGCGRRYSLSSVQRPVQRRPAGRRKDDAVPCCWRDQPKIMTGTQSCLRRAGRGRRRRVVRPVGVRLPAIVHRPDRVEDGRTIVFVVAHAVAVCIGSAPHAVVHRRTRDGRARRPYATRARGSGAEHLPLATCIHLASTPVLAARNLVCTTSVVVRGHVPGPPLARIVRWRQ